MTHRLQLEGSVTVDDALQLARFLDGEAALRGRVSIVNRAPRPGEMGGLIDVIEVAVGSGGAVGLLVNSVTAWLQSRGSDIKVHVSKASGSSIEIDARRLRAASPSDIQRLIERVTEELEPPNNSAG